MHTPPAHHVLLLTANHTTALVPPRLWSHLMNGVARIVGRHYTLSRRSSAAAAPLALRHKSTHSPTVSSLVRRSERTTGGHIARSTGEATRTPIPPVLAPHQRAAPPPSHFAAQPPPPHHGAPRLIRHPPSIEAAQPPPAPKASSLYSYTRGPSSRLFAFRNSATSTRTSDYVYSGSSSASVLEEQAGSMAASDNATLRKRATENGSPSRTSKAKQQQHAEEHDHDHAHAHGLFGHSHAAHIGAEGSVEEADRLLKALKGKGDRGSNITVIGLIANLVLCGAKGVAGVFLHSASLLADAAHSLSDTFSDLVTLFCWKMSQRPASQSHPLGYGKFETMGGLGVSVVLVAGAFAIGMHSYGLLLEVLQPHLQHMPQGLQAIGTLTGDLARAAGGLLHDHHHAAASAPIGAEAGNAAGAILDAAHGAKAQLAAGGAVAATENLLDPNAMWFALISVIVKEWLYHATLKIAREEKSSVLEANAIHHRSDSLSSGVTFLAIGGSYMGFPVLDPLGGLLVAGLIGKQGVELLINALADLSDRGVQPEVLTDFERALQDIVDEVDQLDGPAAAAGKRRTTTNPADGEQDARLLGWKDLRAVRSGVSTFVDVTLIMREDVRLRNARLVETKVRDKLISATKGVKEVRIHLDTQ